MDAARPRLQNFVVTSMPQRSGVYARGETITLEARFGRAVNVSGAVNLALRVDALHGALPGNAS